MEPSNVQWQASVKSPRSVVFCAATNELRLLVGDYGVATLDASNGELRVCEWKLKARATKMAVGNVDADNLYLLQNSDASIQVVRLSNGAPRRKFYANAGMGEAIAVDETRDLLFVGTTRNVVVLRASDGTKVNRVHLPHLPSDGTMIDDVEIAVSLETTELFVAVVTSDAVHVFAAKYGSGHQHRKQARARRHRRRVLPCNDDGGGGEWPVRQVARLVGQRVISVALLAVSNGIVYVGVCECVGIGMVTMVRASDGRQLGHVDCAALGIFPSICATPTALIVCKELRHAVWSHLVPARQPWQPDARVHVQFAVSDEVFCGTVTVVLAVATTASTRRGIGSSGYARLPLELLCTVFAQAAPIVLAE